MKTAAVGKDVDSYCSKCKMLLNHVVVAKVGDQIKRVKCLTCNTEHAHKLAATVTKAKSPAAKKAAPAKVRASDWDVLMQGRDLTRAKRYKPEQAFSKNDVVDHPKFGMGLVLADKEGNKIEVAFQLGPKVLVHNLS